MNQLLLSAGTGGATNTTSNLLTEMGKCITSCISWVGEGATMVSSTPIFLIPIGLGVIGLVIGIVKSAC